MSKILVIYYSRTGNTEKMANAVGKGIKDAGGEAHVVSVEDFGDVEKLPEYDGIIMGSPTYFGILAAPLKDFIDRSIKVYKQLDGRVGGAFASSGIQGGGNETTIHSITQALKVHGLVMPGFSRIGHYGPAAVGKPDEKVISECEYLGKSVTTLAQKIR